MVWHVWLLSKVVWRVIKEWTCLSPSLMAQQQVNLNISLPNYSVDTTHVIINFCPQIVADSDYDPTILDSITITVDRNTPLEGVCFNIPITSDNMIERDETFTISLDAIPGLITLNTTTSQALVTIVNDDGEHLVDM